MKEIPLVTEEQAATARKIEKYLVGLHPSSGILFAGVQVSFQAGSSYPTFTVSIGCDRSLEAHTVEMLVVMQLRKDSSLMPVEARLVVEARRGISRSQISVDTSKS